MEMRLSILTAMLSEYSHKYRKISPTYYLEIDISASGFRNTKSDVSCLQTSLMRDNEKLRMTLGDGLLQS